MKRASIAKQSLLLIVSAAIWLPSLHLFFRPSQGAFCLPGAVAPQAKRMAARHLALWEDPARREREIGRMRASNAEWDFMGRTYLALALCNMAVAEPTMQDRYLAVVDAIIDETIALDKSRGIYF